MKLSLIIASLALSTSAFAAPETLLGIKFSAQSVSIDVASGGCTDKGDFTVAKKVVNGKTQITFNRTNPDFCEAYAPYGTELVYTYEELELKTDDEFKVMNKVNTGSRVYF